MSNSPNKNERKKSVAKFRMATVAKYHKYDHIARVILNEVEVACHYEYKDKYLEKGDGIIGDFELADYTNKGLDYFIPVGEPLILLGRDVRTIRSCFKEAIEKGGDEEALKKCDWKDCYKSIEVKAKEYGKSVDVYMDGYCDARYRRTLNIPFSPPDMDKEPLYVLYIWWCTHRLFRQLQLFGIDKKTARKEKRNLLTVSMNFLRNPFTVINLPFEKAIASFNLIRKQPKVSQIQCGYIARQILTYLNERYSLYKPIKHIKLLTFEGGALSGEEIPDDISKIEAYVEELYNDYTIIKEGEGLYLPYPFKAETTVANYIISCLEQPVDVSKSQAVINMEYNVDTIKDGDKLHIDQKNAIKGSLKHQISIINGAAGTGKTTIIKELVHQIEKRLNSTCIVTSFTGKAVARLKEVMGEDGGGADIFTMDRLIKMGVSGFEYLIIDESSMVSTELFYRFITRVCSLSPVNITLVGDVNQLPPINWGSFFIELSKGNKIPTYTLSKNFRSDVVGDNGIVDNSYGLVDFVTVKHKTSIKIPPYDYKTYNNFNLIPGGEREVMQLVHCLLEFKELEDSFEKGMLKVICPYNKPTDALNGYIKKIRLKGKFWAQDTLGKRWHVDGLVMLKKNFFSRKVMNGDEGIIKYVNQKEDYIVVLFFNGKKVKVSLDSKVKIDKIKLSNKSSDEMEVINVNYLKYSYAITVHNSQGSEWDNVVLVLPPRYNNTNEFVDFNLLYTAITRPRKRFFFVGDPSKFKRFSAIRGKIRYENLSARIE